MTKREKQRRYCPGCYDDFYNHQVNLDGKRECWSLESAKLVWRKEVSIDQCPPWKQKARRFLSCFRRQRYIYVDPKRTS